MIRISVILILVPTHIKPDKGMIISVYTTHIKHSVPINRSTAIVLGFLGFLTGVLYFFVQFFGAHCNGFTPDICLAKYTYYNLRRLSEYILYT